MAEAHLDQVSAGIILPVIFCSKGADKRASRGRWII